MEVEFLVHPELAARVALWLQTQRKAQGSSSKEALHRTAGSFSYEGQFREDWKNRRQEKRRKIGTMISASVMSPQRWHNLIQDNLTYSYYIFTKKICSPTAYWLQGTKEMPIKVVTRTNAKAWLKYLGWAAECINVDLVWTSSGGRYESGC